MGNDDALIAGIVGWPVEHSLSPRLHGYWLSYYGIAGEYVPLAVPPEDLADAIFGLVPDGIRGVNLTIPHKEAVMNLLDSIDDEATAIGAVNTIIVSDDGKLIGRNTDAYGFTQNITPHLPLSRNKAVVLGAGGAAKAVIHALRALGFKDIIVLNRTRTRADELAGWFGGITIEDWENKEAVLSGADLLVNTTSLGMTGKEPLEINLEALPVGALVTDIVYAPLITPLLAAAKARGNPVVDGLGMLLHQAVPGFEAWFGQRPEVTDALRAHVLEGRA